MATYRKRGRNWRVEIHRKDTPRESATFRTKAECEQWAMPRERAVYEDRRGLTRYTLADVLQQYSRDISPAHRGCRWEQIRLAKLARDFEGVETPLRALAASDVARWRDKRLRAVAPASVAREQQLLRAALAVAQREWGWLTLEKLTELKGARKPGPTPPRQRRVSNDEIRRITAALGHTGRRPNTVSQRVAIAFLLAIETGMRCGELCGLKKGDVDVRRRVAHLPVTKNGDARDVPLSKAAVRLVKLLRSEDSVLDVGTQTVDTLFRRARDYAAIENLHFHDARAEFATRTARKVDILTLARILGHRDLKSLQVYYRESAEDIAKRLG